LSTSSFTPQLRPLSIGERLDAGFRLMRHRFGTLVTCVIVPMLPLSILGTIILASTVDGAFDVNATTTTSDTGTILAGWGADVLIEGAGAALAVAACFKVISAAYLGERATARSSLRYGLSRLVQLMVAYVVIGFVLLLLVIFSKLVLPFLLAVFLGVKWSMAFPAIVAERIGPFRAMRRSWQLTRGHWWRTFGTLLVVGLIALVIYVAFIVGLDAAVTSLDSVGVFAYAAVTTLVTVLVFAIVYPLVSSIATVVYYDLRVRSEGFDLQLLARGVGSDTSRFESAPERPGAGPPTAVPVPAGSGGFAPPEGSAPAS
jgi:glycerophosphoryl diester phosphodiesterase family protein